MRATFADALAEPMIVLPCSELRTCPGAIVCDDSVVIPKIDGHRAAERRLDRVLVADAVLQRDHGRRRIELAGKGAQRAQRVDGLDEEKEHARTVEIVRPPGDRHLPRGFVVDAQAMVLHRFGDLVVVVEHRHLGAAGEMVAEERPHGPCADNSDAHRAVSRLLRTDTARRRYCVARRA